MGASTNLYINDNIDATMGKDIFAVCNTISPLTHILRSGAKRALSAE